MDVKMDLMLVQVVVVGMALGVMGGIGLTVGLGGSFDMGLPWAITFLVVGLVMYFGGYIWTGKINKKTT